MPNNRCKTIVIDIIERSSRAVFFCKFHLTLKLKSWKTVRNQIEMYTQFYLKKKNSLFILWVRSTCKTISRESCKWSNFVALRNSSSPIKRFQAHTKFIFVCVCVSPVLHVASLSNWFVYYLKKKQERRKSRRKSPVASNAIHFLYPMIVCAVPVSKLKLICLFWR